MSGDSWIAFPLDIGIRDVTVCVYVCRGLGLLVVAVSDMCSCCAECRCWRHTVYCSGSMCIVDFCRWCGVSDISRVVVISGTCSCCVVCSWR